MLPSQALDSFFDIIGRCRYQCYSIPLLVGCIYHVGCLEIETLHEIHQEIQNRRTVFFCLVFLLYRLYNGANHYYTNKNLKPILDEFLCFGVLSPFLQRKGENNQTRGDEGKTGGENLRLSEVSYDA